MAEQRTDFVAYVDQHIHSVADLKHLIQQGANDPIFFAKVFKSGSWELFDKVYAMSDDSSITAGQQSILVEVAGHISTHVRPREVLLMVLEKISGCFGLFPFQLILHTMQLTIAKGNSLDVWQQGLEAIVRKARGLTSPAHSHSIEAAQSDNEDEEESEQRTGDDLSQSTDTQGAFLDAVLTFAKALVHSVTDSAASNLGTQQPITDLLVSFLLNLNATVITNFADPTVRHHFLATTSVLLLEINNGPYHIFEHINRVRQALHRQALSAARAQFLRHYCHKHSMTQKDLYASTALTTDDANALLNRISQSEYCEVLLSYFDTSTTAATSINNNKIASWAQCVFWDDLLAYQPTHSNNHEDKSSTAGIIEDLPQWNLVGIALFALHVLQATHSIDTSTNATKSLLVPAVYNRGSLVALAQPYVLLLLRDRKLANPEGLQLASLVLTPPPALSQVRTAPSVPIFMSFLTQQTSAASYHHLMLAFYHCLSSRQKNLPGKVYWEAHDANKLGMMSASTNNILALAQTLITAMAGCADSALRTVSFNSLRAYLKNIEERSLFGLLLILTEQCPYPNMAGLLIDLTKECVQAASRGLSWTHLPSSLTHLTCNTNNTVSTSTTITTDTAPVSWLQECADPALRPVGKKKGFPLSKILKHKPVHPDTSIDQPSSTENPALNIDEYTLVSTTRRAPEVRSNTSNSMDPPPIDEYCYLDLHTGTTALENDKYVEVREAMPFMHTGKSPFWSPLVLQRFVLEPLKEMVEHASPDKLLECVDIVAARVNLTQSFALKCLTDASLPPTFTRTTTVSGTVTVESVSGVLDAYFAGSQLYSTAGKNRVFPYAYSKLAAVKDIFELYFLLKQLRGALLRAQKSLPTGASPLETVRVQLLVSNAEYAVANVKKLCEKLYLLLLQTAE